MEPLKDLALYDEETALLPAPPAKSFCGRMWNPYTIVKGVVATASAVGLAVVGYFASKTLLDATETVALPLHNLGVGAGIAVPLLAASVLPEKTKTVVADWVCRWGAEVLQGMTSLYFGAGCPRKECGLWDTKNPPRVVQGLSAFAFSSVASAFTVLSLRTFMTDEETSDELRGEPLKLFIEGGHI